MALEERLAENMAQYWQRELGGAVTQAELADFKSTSHGDLERHMKLLMELVDETAAELRQEVGELDDRLGAAEHSGRRGLSAAKEEMDGVREKLDEVEAAAASKLEQAEERFNLVVGPLGDQVNALAKKVEAAEDSAERFDRSLQRTRGRIEECGKEFHTRLDADLAYVKANIDQGLQLLTTHIDSEISVLDQRQTQVWQGVETVDAALCRLDTKVNDTATALAERVSKLAGMLDDQLSSVTMQVDGSLVELHSRLDAFTKEVQQFVVSSAVEREIARAALASLNAKLNTSHSQLALDIESLTKLGLDSLKDELTQVENRLVTKQTTTDERIGRVETEVKERLGKNLDNLRREVKAEFKELKLQAGSHEARVHRLENDGKNAIMAAIATVESQCTDRLAAAQADVKALDSLLAERMQDVRRKVLTQDGRIEDMEVAIRNQLFDHMKRLHEDMITLEEDVSANIDQANHQLQQRVDKKVSSQMTALQNSLKSVQEMCNANDSYAKTVAMMVNAEQQQMGQGLVHLNDEFNNALDRLDDVEESLVSIEVDTMLQEYAAAV
eukprot:SAG31_NODE_3347_length_4368_cov_3.037643_2_plen_558_part_00